MIEDSVFAIVREKGLCGACFRTLLFERSISFTILRDRIALWDFPTAVLPDRPVKHPIAILCAECASLRRTPVLCVEFGPEFFIRYYRVEILPMAPAMSDSAPSAPGEART